MSDARESLEKAQKWAEDNEMTEDDVDKAIRTVQGKKQI